MGIIVVGHGIYPLLFHFSLFLGVFIARPYPRGMIIIIL